MGSQSQCRPVPSPGERQLQRGGCSRPPGEPGGHPKSTDTPAWGQRQGRAAMGGLSLSWAMGQGSYYPGAQTPQGVTAPSPQGARDSPVTREPHPSQRVPHPAVGVACGVPAIRDPTISGAICAHIPPPPSPALLCRCYPAPGLPGRPQPLPHHGHSCSPGPSPPLPLDAVSQLPGPTPAVAAFLWGKLAPVLSGCKELWDPGGGVSRRAGR